MNLQEIALWMLTCYSRLIYSASTPDEGSPLVQCGEETIQIEIPTSIVKKQMSHYFKNDLDLSEVVVYLSPSSGDLKRSCVLRRELSSPRKTYRIHIPFPFKICETTSRLESSTTTVLHRNRVWWRVRNVKKTPMLPLLLLDVNCVVHNASHARFLPDIVCCDPQPIMTSEGFAQLEMEFWRSLEASDVSGHPLVPPFEYLVNEKLYFSLRVSRDNGRLEQFNFESTQCALLDRYNLEESTYTMIVHPISDPASVFIKKDASNKRNVQFFSLTPLKLNMTYAYLQCHVIAVGSRDQPLGKEESSTFHLSATRGPLMFVHSVERGSTRANKDLYLAGTTKTNEVVSPNKLLGPLLLLVSNFLFLALLGLLCYVLAASVERKRRRKARRLTGESLFNNNLEDESSVEMETKFMKHKASCSRCSTPKVCDMVLEHFPAATSETKEIDFPNHAI